MWSSPIMNTASNSRSTTPVTSSGVAKL